ncbi:MAG: hypothetical protein OIN66_05845 [Candidatus Methanoperedens sp.]|nr:hypothetical protein [Candidatus Methanoperedens sp.]
MRDIIKKDCKSEGKSKEKIRKIKIILAVLTTLSLFSLTGMVVLATLGCIEKPQHQEELILSNYPKLFEKDVIIVVGENTTQIENDATKAIAYNLGEFTGNTPVIKTDAEVTEIEKAGYNLILLGRSDTNKMLRDIYERTNATRVTDEYPGAGKGVLEVLGNPWNESKVMLLVQGSDEWGVRAGSVILEEKQKVKDKAKVVVDWEEATGVKFPIDSAEEAIRYANMDVKVKRFVKTWSTTGNKVKAEAKFSNSSNNWDIMYRADTPILENWYMIVINSNGTIIDKRGFL